MYLISNGLQLLSLGQGGLDAIVLNQLRDQVAEHRLAMGHCPVQATEVFAVVHVVYIWVGRKGVK